MSPILKDRSFQISILLTFLFFGTGIAFLMLGLVGYSWSLFIGLPIVLGISIGAMPNPRYTLIGAVAAAVIFLMGLYIPGLSGLLCIVMTLPIIVPFIFLGYIIMHLARRYREIKSTEKLPVLLLPLVPFLFAGPVEHFFKKDPNAVMEVRSEKVFNYTPEQVYDAIKSVDTVYAEKSFLMNFDLPIPVKCVMDKEEVGGIRTCYFDAGRWSNADFGSGTITEKITELERGKILKMDVIDYTLVGREWLGFKEAIYLFEKTGENACKMTRITTYTSVLTPRMYWEPLERMGVEQEHEYVFKNLERDLKERHGK